MLYANSSSTMDLLCGPGQILLCFYLGNNSLRLPAGLTWLLSTPGGLSLIPPPPPNNHNMSQAHC